MQNSRFMILTTAIVVCCVLGVGFLLNYHLCDGIVSKEKTTKARILGLQIKLHKYKAMYRAYPVSSNIIQELKYMDCVDEMFLDGWGEPFQFEVIADEVNIWSSRFGHSSGNLIAE